MASPKAKPKSKKTSKSKPADIELEPDAMQRFERAIGVMAPVRRKKVTKK